MFKQKYLLYSLTLLSVLVVQQSNGFDVPRKAKTTTYPRKIISSSTTKTIQQQDSAAAAKNPPPLMMAATALPPTTTTSSTSDFLSLQQPQQVQSSANDSKIGVLLLNLGGPAKGEDVEGFLYNLFADPDIIRLPTLLTPLQSIIAYFISKRRAPKSRAAYDSIGGGSPILKYSQAQANLLTKSLQERYDIPVKTYIGMRYWYPFTEEALEEIRKDQIEALVIVPLYPQFSISTSGSSLRVLQEEFSKNAESYGSLIHTVIPSWYDRPGYVKAVANLLQNELDAFTSEQIDSAKSHAPELKPLHVLFSAHGVPQSYIDAGDPYKQQIEDCVDRISKYIVNDKVDVHLSYQSRVGPIEWLRPYTDDVLPELAEKGVINLVVVPISFVSEHIETLEEIDIEYRELAEESGIKHWRRCPALNMDESFIDDMADMVVEALSEPAQTVTEACVANSVSDVEFEPLVERMGLVAATSTAIVPTTSNGATAAAGGTAGSINSPKGQAGVTTMMETTTTTTTPSSDKTLQDKERLNARVAMIGVAVTLIVELISGQSLVDLFGNIIQQ